MTTAGPPGRQPPKGQQARGQPSERQTSGRQTSGRQTSGRQPSERGGHLRGLTVQGWFRLGFAAFAVLVLVAAVIIIELLAHSREVSGELESTILPAQAQAYRLQGALVDQETGVRGYGITGDVRFLQPYTSGLSIEASAAARLRALVGATDPLAADLASLERAAQGWRRADAIPLIALARHGPLSGGDVGLLDQSKSSFDHLRTLFAAQNAHLAATAARDEAAVRRARAVQDWALAAVLVVLLLASAGLTLVLQQTVVRPLSRLRAASRRVVGGDFGHHIEATGPSDLRTVAADIEEMRSGLVTALDGARAAEQVAAQQAADLDSQATELRRSNAELEQFAYVASHDLQEPLRKVASFCQLLERRYGEQLDDRGRQYIGFAVDGARRLQILINDLLTFSRVGRASGAPAAVPLDETVDTAIAALGAAIEESGAAIERPARLPDVPGYASLLAMLWQNLIGNAIKFRSPGRAPVVRITVADAQDGKWEFCVTDNGIGIAPEFAEKVFVIFQRLHGRESYPGTGIGLALCKRIIEHHGGDISLDTGYADGTRICFTLPRIAVAPDPADDSAATSAATHAATNAATNAATSAEGIPA
jgi:signal transduction histidine kinase